MDKTIWLRHKQQAHVFEQKAKDLEVEFRIIRADGKIRWISHVCNPVYTKDGTFKGFRGSNRDITYRKQLEERILQTEKLESIARLAGGIAHDLNNLMTIVVGHAELLNIKLPVNAPKREYALKILKAAERASNLAERLLTYAIGSKIKYSYVLLNEIIEEVLKLQEKKLAPFKLNISLVKDLWPIWADVSQIFQVIRNLVSNAIEAMSEGGTLTITTKNIYVKEQTKEIPPGKYVYLKVSDTGCGMDKEILDRIFDPFFSTKNFGRGLGLSIVYGIVRNSKGYIFVDSSLGKGTTFEIYFPAAEMEESKNLGQ